MSHPFVCLALLLAAVTAQAAETVIVSDELPINVRRGPGTRFAIIAAVKSGAELEVLERREDGYLRVRTPKNNEGWVLTRLVQTGPVARQQLAALRKELELARAEVGAVQAAQEQWRSDLARAEAALERSRSRQEELRVALEQAQAAGATTVALEQENRRLRQRQGREDTALSLAGPLIALGLALCSLLIAGLTVLRWRRFRREELRGRKVAGRAQLDFAAAAEQAVGDIRHSVSGLAGLLRGAQQRLTELERQSRQLETPGDVAAVEPRLPEAIALAREGIAPQDIMRRCGLSLAEAQLLAQVHAGLREAPSA